jgi:hypothetical protein
MSSLEGRTPYGVWNGSKPAIQHLCTFGCVVYTKVTWPHLAKLDDRGRKGIFTSYDPVEGRMYVPLDVIFDENTLWSSDINGDEEQNM